MWSSPQQLWDSLPLPMLTTPVWHRLHKRYTSCFCHGSSGASRAWRVQEKGEQKQLACWHAGQAPPQAGDAARGFVQIDAFCHKHGEHGEKRRRVWGRASGRASARRCPCRGHRGQPRQPQLSSAGGAPLGCEGSTHCRRSNGRSAGQHPAASLARAQHQCPVKGLLPLRCAVHAQ